MREQAIAIIRNIRRASNMKLFKLCDFEYEELKRNGRFDLGYLIIRLAHDNTYVYNRVSDTKWTGYRYEQVMLKTYPCKIKILK